ncbi:glycosyltransferase [Porticoccus sp.]
MQKHAGRLVLAGVSDAIRDDARRALPAFPRQDIQTVYNHIDFNRVREQLFSRADARQKLGLCEADFVVGNVGRLHPDKDQTTLIEAFAQALPEISDARLIIIGEGRLRPSLEQRIKHHNLEGMIELKGRVPEAFRYFRAFDVFTLSSDFEPFGMVLLEAMAAGVPVISSNCGGAPEVLGGDGTLFPVGDAGALAAGLVRLYQSDGAARAAMSEALLERLKANFTDEAVRQSFWTLPITRTLC